jgi:adenylate cyclase
MTVTPSRPAGPGIKLCFAGTLSYYEIANKNKDAQMDRPFPAYQGDKPFIFVSYSHQDAELVYPEISYLKDQGFNIWYDEGISPGASWREELAESILSSSLFIIYVSPRSVESDNCVKEVSFALENGASVLAVHLEETQLTPGQALALSDRQAILKYELSQQDYADKLIKGISEYIRSNAAPHQVASAPSMEPQSNTIQLMGFGLIALAILGSAFLLRSGKDSVLEDDVVINKPAPTEQTPMSAESKVATAAKPSIAVLPFDNLSPLEENAYFAAGIHEDILTSLSKVPNLKVISRTSVMRYADSEMNIGEITSELNVDHILEGSVRRAGNKVRITVQLIKTDVDEHLWAETYDRDLADIFAVQSEVAKNIAQQLKVALAPDSEARISKGPTRSVEAYDLYLRGRDLLRQSSTITIDEAMSNFERAVELDPQFAQAYSGMAIGYLSQANINTEWQSVRASATAAAQRGLELDPMSSETHYAMGRVHFRDRQYSQADQYFLKAIELDPNFGDAIGWYGQSLYFQGRHQEALLQWRQAVELDPLSPTASFAMALVLRSLHRMEEAQGYISRSVELRPEEIQTYLSASGFYFFAGDHFRRLKYLDQAYRKDPGNLQAVMNIGSALHWLGNVESAEHWLDVATGIAPRNEGLLSRRVDLLNSVQRLDEAAALTGQWLEQNPDSHQGLRMQAAVLGQQANAALAAGNADEAGRLRESAMTFLDRYLAPDRVNGVLQVKEDNIWGVASYAATAGSMGNRQLAQSVSQSIIDYYKEEQTLNFAHFHLTLAYALTGNTTKAMEHFSRVPGTAFNAIWIIDAYGLTQDIASAYHGLSSHPSYQETIEKITRSNNDVLARIKTEMPHLLVVE